MDELGAKGRIWFGRVVCAPLRCQSVCSIQDAQRGNRADGAPLPCSSRGLLLSGYSSSDLPPRSKVASLDAVLARASRYWGTAVSE